MRDRDAILSMYPKSADMLGDPIRKAELAFLDQRPARCRRDDFGVRKQREERSLIDRAQRDRSAAQTAVKRQLAMPRDGQLRARMETFANMASNDLADAIEFPGIETNGFRARGLNRRRLYCRDEH